MRPSKPIMALLKELNEYEAEFRAEACSNLDLVIWIVRMDAHIIKLVYSRLIGLRVLSRDRL